MIRSRTTRTTVLVLGCSFALAFAGFGINVGVQATKDSKVALPAEQVIASIKTAIAAKPGDVRAVEIENEGGKSICEVEILASDGKTYEVEVDVATNTVVEVEMDDDADKDNDDQD